MTKAIRSAFLIAGLLVPLAASGQGAAPQPSPQDRAALEQRVRERMAAMIKNRLGLTDDQMKKLGETNTRYEERRRLLREQERDIRMGMRDELLLGDKANQTRVGEMLDRLLRVQRQRLDIVEQEQKELSGYLTPVQRVRFHALQDQMKKWRDELRGGGPDRRPGSRPRGAGRIGPRDNKRPN
jgi:hypothetical protein